MTITRILACAILLFVAACSTKVDNPDNDNDQDQPEAIEIDPISINFIELPDASKMNIDPRFKDLIVDTFALMKSSNSLLAQLNEFFAIVNENKLAREGAIVLEKDGVKLTGRSWYTAESDGLYFCKGGEKVFYITWSPTRLHIFRSLKHQLPVSSYPMTDGLGANIEAVISNIHGSLSVSYSGIKRDPQTLQDTSDNIAFHYDAFRTSDVRTDYSGIYVETDAAGAIPAVAGRRIIGALDSTQKGEALAHLLDLCPAFDEAASPMPAWCVSITHDATALDAGLGGVDERWEKLKAIKTPKHSDLKKVDFPSDMECPVE